MYRGDPARLEDILDALFEIAKADGVLHPGELNFLQEVARIFGFTEADFRRIRATHFGAEGGDPYVVLGVAYEAADEDDQARLSQAGARKPSRRDDRARRSGGIRQAGEREARAINARLRKDRPRTGADVTPMRLSGLALVALVCLAWGFNAVAIKVGGDYLPPLFSSGLRCLIVFICMLPVASGRAARAVAHAR